MDSTLLDNQQPNPKRLKTLSFDVKHPGGNKLLHQFVLDNSEPNVSGSENYINAVLMSMASTSINVNTLNDEGYSPLHLAVLKNNLLMVKKLLSCLPNIDVNKKCSFDRDDNTALHLAAESGHLPIIQELLNSGSHVDNGSAQGFTALCFAAKSGNLALMKILVSKGANVNAKCICEDYMHRVVVFHNSEALKSFISSGAHLNMIDYENETILKYSVPPGRRILFGSFSDKYEYSYRCKGLSPIHHAVESENTEAIKFLIDNGAILSIGRYYFCPLLHAKLATFALLVNNGLDVNAKNDVGCTLLHHAATEGNVEIIKFLVSKNVDVNAKNNNSCTPLHYAAHCGHVKAVEFLIKNGADMYAENYYCGNVLNHAAESAEVACVEIFVNSGVDLNVVNEEGCTPLHCALDFESWQIELDVVKFLISSGANVNAKDNSGHSCLHYAVRSYNLEAVKLLVSNGADLDAVNCVNQNALDYARDFRNVEILQFLLSIGAKFSNKIF